jgi:Ca2+-binding EF-hand superfamily protein
MKNFAKVCVIATAIVLVVAACAGGGRGGRPNARFMGRPAGNPPAMTDLEQSVRLMLSYDANSDGTVTRDELEAGLKRQFAACDVNGDGRLSGAEIQAENDRRWKANSTGYSPLIDWNQDGYVDFSEFSTTARSVFEALDRSHRGVLTRDELRLPVIRGRAPNPVGSVEMGGRRG